MIILKKLMYWWQKTVSIPFLYPEYTVDDLLNEQINLDWDTKAYMYCQVRNKNARYNLCYENRSQEPDYENGKGRIVAFKDVPVLNLLRKRIPLVIGNCGNNMVAEGNYYHDIDKCGISFHGDSERKKLSVFV